jgi:tetratricopeptide (TPR) repeat protein
MRALRVPSPVFARFLSRADRALPILAAALIASASALAQAPQDAPDDTTTAPSDARDMTDAARKAYGQSIKEARDLIAKKRYDEAIVKLDKLTAERPREAQARFLKGVALTDQGKTDDAAAQFRALLADYPELPEPRNNLAVLYAQRGELAQARDELEIAIRTAPDYAIAHENLGDIYARLAADEYDRTLALDKRNKTAPAKLKLVREVTATTPH